MRRTRILLENWQHTALKDRAAREGKSLSALIRAILTLHLGRTSGRLRFMEGAAEGPHDLAADHDRYLYGAAGE